MISADTTIARVIDEHPQLVEVLAAVHPHFERLRNRILRKLMAPRVTVAQAAQIAGISPEKLLAELRRAVGEPPGPGESGGAIGPTPPVAAGLETDRRPKPAALAAVPDARHVHLDVRQEINSGTEPFGRIMAAVKDLGPDEVLVLRAPFEPIPLYQVLDKRGFAHWTERRALDDWSVWFYRAGGGETAAAKVSASGGPLSPGTQTVTIDVRGLEPPQPMIRVLEELGRLAPDQQLEVVHERRPLFLYPQLDDRGFVHETDEPAPGLVRILIRRAAIP
jgi:uncharacterized protein (DUF2249 family)